MAIPLSPPSRLRWPTQHIWVGCAVLVAHAGAVWSLQSNWPPQPPEVVPEPIISAAIISEIPATPTVAPAPPPPVQPKHPTAVPQPRPPARKAPAPTAPPVVASNSANSPVQVAAPVPHTDTRSSPTETETNMARPPSTASSNVTSPAPAAPPAPAKIELPNASASYLNNPKPPYPALSKRLGEEGKVVVRVWIDTDGRATQAEIKTSSGYERLDQTALRTVLAWRYIPGKRAGVPEGMWFNIPLNFVLE